MGFVQVFAHSSGRSGQQHWAAKRTDLDVELARTLHDQGWGYRRIARHLAVPRATVQSWCNYRRR